MKISFYYIHLNLETVFNQFSFDWDFREIGSFEKMKDFILVFLALIVPGFCALDLGIGEYWLIWKLFEASLHWYQNAWKFIKKIVPDCWLHIVLTFDIQTIIAISFAENNCDSQSKFIFSVFIIIFSDWLLQLCFCGIYCDKYSNIKYKYRKTGWFGTFYIIIFILN
jgi:hypothetical protein